MKKFTGFIIFIAISLITLNLWLLSKQSLNQITSDILRSFSQIFALEGIVWMSLTLILATRITLVENIFGGLDKTYINHHILGSLSFIFLLNHPLFLAAKSLPQLSLARMYLFPGNNLIYNLGIFGIYTMIFCFLFIVFIRLPYNIWKFTHKFLGLAFLFGSAHAFFIQSDMSTFLPLRIWVLFFIAIGLLSSFYIIFLYKSFGPRYLYQITKIDRLLDIVNIYLKPISRKLIFQPGQFVYVSFKTDNPGQESHPFSFSSSPDEKTIRISTKIVGDYTLKLPNLTAGINTYLYGPYGKFGKAYIEKQHPLIWVAGGIGITPFLSMLRSQPIDNNKIIFFYCVKNNEEAVFKDEIEEEVKKNKNIEFHPWLSVEKGRLDVKKVLNIINSFDDYLIQICGPPPMMNGLKKQLLEYDIPEDRIIMENFSLIQ